MRVPLYTNNDSQKTRSTTPQIYQIPQLSTPSLPRVDHSTKKNKHQTKKYKTKLNTSTPAHNTRSLTQATGPVSRKRARIQLKKIKNSTHIGRAATVNASIAQLENEVHQSLAVMDTDTGKIISYKQLMRNPKLNKMEHVFSKRMRTAIKWVWQTNKKPN